ncbi:MAG: FHA domain-containing protein [Bacteroidaceae bacterium]|nr:FHA domain-containing protein [Bacteroidaceae bacterium]
MSSNKTIIPGMEDAYNGQTSFVNQNTPFQNSFGSVPTPASTKNQKPIVGFLYSISKSHSGEFWPLRVGSNSIGRSAGCDVCLGEATVSEQHAILVVRQMKNPEKIIASICDARSTCGTMINGESLGFDQRECFNGDIITIGEHYDLYFILIDAKQIGLSVCQEFMGLETQENQFRGMSNIMADFPIQQSTSVNSSTIGYDQDSANLQNSGVATVGFNEPIENKSPSKPGGTIFM